MTAPADETAVASLTGALVDANDRLLGLLALITNAPPTSLSADDLATAIIEQAAPLLSLNRVEIAGAFSHTWTKPGAVGSHEETDAEWCTAVNVVDVGELAIRFARHGQRFDTGDTKVLAAIAKLIGNAVATADVHERVLEQEVVSREHTAAAEVAAAALPNMSVTPTCAGLSFFADLVPARETGGDLFTWKEIDGDIWFAVGDVSGKGLPAAVMMSTAVSSIDASIEQHHAAGPVAVLAAVDQWLHQRLSTSAMFLTLVIGKWNADNGVVAIANAGHSPVVWCRRGTTERVAASVPPLGVLDGCQADLWSAQVDSGDVMVIATDGFTEQTDSTGALFGEDTFDEVIARTSSRPNAELIGRSLLATVANHGAGCEQSDDRALMVLRFS